MNKADITIIGAGVIGLAIAAQVAGGKREVLVLEKNETFGQETSSRNSQVIHAGIYYPEDSLKARTSVEGNALLYELCEKQGIACEKVGKLIVATDAKEIEQLEILLEQGNKNEVKGLRMLSSKDIAEMEPNVRATAALFSPSTGLIDAHALMSYFLSNALEGGVQTGYRTEVTGIEKRGGAGYQITVTDPGGSFSFTTAIVINCAGLHSDKVAGLVGIDIARAGYKLYYGKGEYFRVDGGKSKLVKRLIYPVPEPERAGLGIHATPGLDGVLLLGPDIRYVDKIDYSIDGQRKEGFFNSAAGFLPFLRYDDLEPEMAGIRPTLMGPGDDFRDFIIRDERDKGLPGFINLIGIESPGLTAAPAIAKYVNGMVKDAW